MKNVSVRIITTPGQKPKHHKYEAGERIKDVCALLRKFSEHSWFQTFAVFWMMLCFFWVIPRRLNSDAGELPRRKRTNSRNLLY